MPSTGSKRELRLIKPSPVAALPIAPEVPRTPREGESSEATEVLADAPRIVEALVAPTIPVAAGIVRAVNRFLLCLKNFEYADARS